MATFIQDTAIPKAEPNTAITSTVHLPHDFHLDYHLEGSPDPQSPVLLFSNELLTTFHIWDPTIKRLKQRLPHFRFLRYNTRGYATPTTAKTITLSTLTSDINALLSHLKISTLHSLVGVGLGGLTALAFASTHPNQLRSFVACNFELASSPELREHWDAQLAYAEKYGMGGILADKVVARWFTADSRASAPWKVVHEMVGSASMPGLATSMHALYEYDESEKMREIRVPGLFVAGATDCIFPEVMSEFPDRMATGLGEFVEIERAGRLPMLESAEAFVGVLDDFLERKVRAQEVEAM